MDEKREPAVAQKNSNETREKAKTIALKALAIVGLVALLSLGTWGTVQLIRTSPKLASSISAAVTNFTARFFPAGSITLQITLDSYSVKSDEPLELTWTIENKPDGATYAFVYECADGLSFLTPTTSGANTRIACGELYTFDTDASALLITPVSPDSRFLDVAVKVTLVAEETIVAEDEAFLTVVNERISTNGNSTTTPEKKTSKGSAVSSGVTPTYFAPVYTTVTVPRVSDPNGFVDLAVEITKVGILEGKSDRFDSVGTTLDRDERGGIVFSVRNLGTKTAENWSFEVQLPTSPSYTFRRSGLQDLAPGDRIEYTLGFDRLKRSDDAEITVTVDPKDRINESNESNNEDEIDVEIE